MLDSAELEESTTHVLLVLSGMIWWGSSGPPKLGGRSLSWGSAGFRKPILADSGRPHKQNSAPNAPEQGCRCTLSIHHIELNRGWAGSRGFP